MALPDPKTFPVEKVHEAFETFDKTRRPWRPGPTSKYVAVYGGQEYPPKDIVALATGIPKKKFSGGEAPGQANHWLRAMDFTVEDLTTDGDQTSFIGKGEL